MILECESCKQILAVKMSNPVESSVLGAEKIDVFEGYDDAALFFKYGLVESDVIAVAGIEYKTAEKKPLGWPFGNVPIYFDNEVDFESLAFKELAKAATDLNKEFKNYVNWYVKGQDCKRIFVVLNFHSEGTGQRAIFSKNIEFEGQLNIKDLLMVHHSSADLSCNVDGLYSKDQCFVFLQKLLLRWMHIADSVLLVVPFVGYPYKGQAEKNVELWEFLDTHTDLKKTQVLTRKATFGLYRSSAATATIPYEVMEEWDFLPDLQKSLHESGKPFFQASHAKFYAGIFKGRVEVLSGSYNLHKGPSMENIVFRNYSTEEFANRYTDRLGDSFMVESEDDIPIYYFMVVDEKVINGERQPFSEFEKLYLR